MTKLYKTLSKKSGRNNRGVITSRHKGGGHKKKYRCVNFDYSNGFNQIGTIKSIEYDPYRTTSISKVEYNSNKLKEQYILTPKGISIGDTILSSFDSKLEKGNCVALKEVGVGTCVYNIELEPGKGGQIARSGGSYCRIISKNGDRIGLTLPSGEVRTVHENCWCTIGIPAGQKRKNIGKAGRNRWLGKRPRVRGSAMNPIDHPHGGGEGKAPIGRKHPVTPWGKATLGKKTRRKNKQSSKFILSRRKKIHTI